MQLDNMIVFTHHIFSAAENGISQIMSLFMCQQTQQFKFIEEFLFFCSKSTCKDYKLDKWPKRNRVIDLFLTLMVQTLSNLRDFLKFGRKDYVLPGHSTALPWLKCLYVGCVK